MASIKLSTGLKVYDIEDERGVVRGSICFNPKDMNFPARMEEFIKDVDKIIESLGNMPNDVTEEDMAYKIKEFDEQIKQELNKLFADDRTSKVVFGEQNCFNQLNGETFIERFINAIIPIIMKDFEKSLEDSERLILSKKKSIIEGCDE